jgi:hypothetical protein
VQDVLRICSGFNDGCHMMPLRCFFGSCLNDTHHHGMQHAAHCVPVRAHVFVDNTMSL